MRAVLLNVVCIYILKSYSIKNSAPPHTLSQTLLHQNRRIETQVMIAHWQTHISWVRLELESKYLYSLKAVYLLLL